MSLPDEFDIPYPGGGARVDKDWLEINEGARMERFRLRDVEALRLSYRPRSLDYHVFRLDLRMRDGRTLKLHNISSQPGAMFKPHQRWDSGYRLLAQGLVERVAAQAPAARMEAGFPAARYWIAGGAGAIILVTMALRLAQALALQDWRVAAVAGLGACVSALFLWPFLRRNKPRSLRSGMVPAEVLP